MKPCLNKNIKCSNKIIVCVDFELNSVMMNAKLDSCLCILNPNRPNRICGKIDCKVSHISDLTLH